MTAETIAPVEAPSIDTAALAEIEERVVTGVSLADLMRRGSAKTIQSDGWGYGNAACALAASALEARDLGFLK